MLNEITALDIRFVSREDVLIRILNIFDGFELIVRFFFLKCSISGNTGLSISNSSGVGLSEKFEQLDSPTPVSDLIQLISLMKFFYASNYSGYKPFSYDSDPQELHTF